MNVFRVEDDTNRFVAFRDKRSDLLNHIYKDMLYGTSIAKYWTKGGVDIVPGRVGDFAGGPVIFARISATSRVIDVLGEHLTSCCELLPFDNARTAYWALYLPRTYDCLDRARSTFWSKSPDNAQVRDHEFIESRIPEDLLFRMPGSFNYYSTDRFVSLVQRHAFTGLIFRRVWSSGDEGATEAESALPIALPGDLPRVIKRKVTKRDNLLQRLWADAIDSWTTSDRLAEMFSAKLSDLPALTSEGFTAIRRLQELGLKPADLTHLARAIAYQATFDVLQAIEEEGLDRNAALKSLHEDLLIANPNP